MEERVSAYLKFVEGDPFRGLKLREDFEKNFIRIVKYGLGRRNSIQLEQTCLW
jgi:hypothetical protein